MTTPKPGEPHATFTDDPDYWVIVRVPSWTRSAAAPICRAVDFTALCEAAGEAAKALSEAAVGISNLLPPLEGHDHVLLKHHAGECVGLGFCPVNDAHRRMELARVAAASVASALAAVGGKGGGG